MPLLETQLLSIHLLCWFYSQLLHRFRMAALTPLSRLHPHPCGVRVTSIYRRAVKEADQFHVHVLGASGTLHLRLRAHCGAGDQGQPGLFISLAGLQLCGDHLHPPDRVPQELPQRQGRVLEGPQLPDPAKGLTALPRVVQPGPGGRRPCSAEGPELGPSAGPPALSLPLWSPSGNLFSVPKNSQLNPGVSRPGCSSVALLGMHRTLLQLIPP